MLLSSLNPVTPFPWRLGWVTVTGVLVACAIFGLSVPSASFADESGAAAPADQHADHDHEDHDHAGHGEGDHDHGSHDDSEAHAEGHHAPPLLSLDPGAAIWNLLIFLAVLTVLSKFVWPNILSGLQAREDKIRADLEGAEKANIEAKAMLSQYQSKLDDAATQVQTMLAEARKDAEANGQKIIEDAKAEAVRQQERAMADIETAKKVALSELAGQTSDMAIAVAGQVVGRELKADDHADLIRQSLDRLPSNN